MVKIFFRDVAFELPWWLIGKESAWDAGDACGRCGFSSWVRKIPWSRKWEPTPEKPGRLLHGVRHRLVMEQ